jgi:flagellar hook-associated protein 2
MATGMDLGISGLASGFDWKSFVDQMAAAQRSSQVPFKARQNSIQQRNAAFTTIKDKLTALQTAIKALSDTSRFDTRTTSTSDATAATATAAAGTLPGAYSFQITRLATSSRIAGVGNIAGNLLSEGEVSSIPISNAGWPMPLTSGTFTINNRQVTVETGDTLQQIFDKIATATDNQVTASYSPTQDRITLVGQETIVLGSATDTSNFLQAARLSNNGTTSVESTLTLGSVRSAATLSSANLTTPITDGGAGAGEFKINGVSITYNAASDSIAGVLDKINRSAAGVRAAYDAVNDRFTIISAASGDIGIALEDITGNFLAATGLTGGTLERGQDLLYTLNDGPELSSRSNTITEASSGITGLSVTALKENSTVTVNVANDTDAAKTLIQNFVEAYNQVVSYISKESASTTKDGKVTAGPLAADSSAESIASSLRSAAFASLASLSASMNELADLGFQTNGYDKKITLAAPENLDSALKNDLTGVRQMFTDSTNGLAAKLDKIVTRLLGDDGELQTRQTSLTKQIAEIDAHIARMEKSVTVERERLTRAFIEMEAAQARINQQLQYLTQNFK